MKKTVKQTESLIWQEEKQKKSTLALYSKESSSPEEFYDNTRGSSLLFQVRGRGLKTRHYRSCIEGIDPRYVLCKERNRVEDLQHVLVECEAL